jgi:iron complex transport system permease protein
MTSPTHAIHGGKVKSKLGFDRATWRVFMLVLFVVLAAAGFFVSVAKGAITMSVSQVVHILLEPGSDSLSQIIWNIRLPRTIVGALVGMNLALSGAILQAIMRNPLADPHIIGISSGAGLAGITVMILFPHLEYLVTPVAFIGAMVAATAIYVLAWKNGIKPVRIILAGVAVSAFLSAGISSLLIFYSDRVHGALMWMVGGLATRSWPHVNIILPYAILGLILAVAGAHYLNVLQLGDDMARGLGLNVEATRIILTAIASLLAASAVSVAGLLGFVGLIVPHITRLLIGSDYRFLIPGAGILGMAVVTFSDTFARVILAPVELPVGIIMAFVGAPFFLFLLRREI